MWVGSALAYHVDSLSLIRLHAHHSFHIVATVPQCQQLNPVVQIQAQAYLSDNSDSNVECPVFANPASIQVLTPVRPAKGSQASNASCTQQVLPGDFLGDAAGKCVLLRRVVRRGLHSTGPPRSLIFLLLSCHNCAQLDTGTLFTRETSFCRTRSSRPRCGGWLRDRRRATRQMPAELGRIEGSRLSSRSLINVRGSSMCVCLGSNYKTGNGADAATGWGRTSLCLQALQRNFSPIGWNTGYQACSLRYGWSAPFYFHIKRTSATTADCYCRCVMRWGCRVAYRPLRDGTPHSFKHLLTPSKTNNM